MWESYFTTLYYGSLKPSFLEYYALKNTNANMFLQHKDEVRAWLERLKDFKELQINIPPEILSQIRFVDFKGIHERLDVVLMRELGFKKNQNRVLLDSIIYITCKDEIFRKEITNVALKFPRGYEVAVKALTNSKIFQGSLEAFVMFDISAGDINHTMGLPGSLSTVSNRLGTFAQLVQYCEVASDDNVYSFDPAEWGDVIVRSKDGGVKFLEFKGSPRLEVIEELLEDSNKLQWLIESCERTNVRSVEFIFQGDYSKFYTREYIEALHYRFLERTGGRTLSLISLV
jgi:hypothetical protein